MTNIASYVSFFAFGLSVLFIFLLVNRYRKSIGIHYLIGLSFCFLWIEFYMYALSSKSILHMPFLFRSAMPFRFLVGPFLFCYVTYAIGLNQKNSLQTLVHFIIPFLFFVLLIPDFLLPVSEKMATLRAYYVNNDIYIKRKSGFIPPGFIQPLNIIYSAVYCLLSFLLFKKHLEKQRQSYHINNRDAIRWIYILISIVTFFFLAHLIQYLFLRINQHLSSYVQLLQSFSLILLKLYLIGIPSTLGFINGCTKALVDKHEILPRVNIKTNHDKYIPLIDSYWKNSETFYKHDFTLDLMAVELQINRNRLSEVLRDMYGLHFNELINRYRVYAFIEYMGKEDSRLHKMDTIASRFGFQHRSTFHQAFKRITGETPNQYLKKRYQALQPLTAMD